MTMSAFIYAVKKVESIQSTAANTDVYEQLAKSIVRADYPDILCMSDSGAFRIYKVGTYKLGITVNGWNIWTGDCTPGTTFHLSKCEIK